MQIEVRNLIIIAVALIGVAILFALRKKIIFGIIIFGLAAFVVAKAVSLEAAIQKANEIRQNAEQFIDDTRGLKDTLTDVTTNIDPGQITDDLKQTADDVLPDRLYKIKDDAVGFGLDEDTDDNAEEVVDKFKEIFGETNK